MGDKLDFGPDAPSTPEEEARNRELLAELGLASFLAQGIEYSEYSVVTLLAAVAMRDQTAVPDDELRELMDTRYRQTLGPLIKATTAGSDLPKRPWTS